MQIFNRSEAKRQTINQYSNNLRQTKPDDEVEFHLWQNEIDILLEAGLIEPAPLQGWFDKIFWRGQQFRSTSAGYPNVTIYKRAVCK